MTDSKQTSSTRSCKNLLLSTALLAGSLGIISSTAQAEDNSNRAVAGDFDGDGKSDIIVTRSALAGDTHKMWLARFSSGAPHEPVIFGLSGDTELTADFDGDGVKDLVVFRPDHEITTPPLVRFYTAQTSGGITERTFGLVGDKFLTGYFDYDDKEELVAVRKVNGGLTWFISLTDPESVGLESVAAYNWGLENDTPFFANINGDDYDDLIVARDNHIPGFKSWFVKQPFFEEFGEDHAGIIFGLSTDIALPPADFNGDGAADLMVSRIEGDFVYIYVRISKVADKRSSRISDEDPEEPAYEPQILTFQFGLKDDIIVPGFHFDSEKANFLAFRRGASNAQAVSYLTLPGDSAHFPSAVPFGLSNDTFVSPLGQIFSPNAETEKSSVTGGSIASLCSSIHAPFTGFLWKPSSDHSGFPREGKPMIAWNSRPPANKTCLRVLDQNGNVVTQFGRYTTGGNYGARWYSGWGCGTRLSGSEIANSAERTSGSRQVYVESNDGRCIGPINPSARNGALIPH